MYRVKKYSYKTNLLPPLQVRVFSNFGTKSTTPVPPLVHTTISTTTTQQHSHKNLFLNSIFTLNRRSISSLSHWIQKLSFSSESSAKGTPSTASTAASTAAAADEKQQKIPLKIKVETGFEKALREAKDDAEATSPASPTFNGIPAQNTTSSTIPPTSSSSSGISCPRSGLTII